MIHQTPPEPENNTLLTSPPAYLRKTSSALEIRITDCFWYPQLSFDWKKLTAAEFHRLINKIRTGLLYIARLYFPAEENNDRGFSRIIKEHLQKTPEGQIIIILHPIQQYENSGRKTPSSLKDTNTPAEKTKTANRQNKTKRWMEIKELQNKLSLACELKKTGGYIIRISEILNCTRQQIHTAMKCHGFLRGEVMIFRGNCCCS